MDNSVYHSHTPSISREPTKCFLDCEPEPEPEHENKKYIDYNTVITFDTKENLKVTLYKNEHYIKNSFINRKYWDINTLNRLEEYIDPNKNILELGGHCGTSSLIYSRYTNKKVYVYEPQYNMFKLLQLNINQNNLSDKIIPINKGVFCYEGTINMSGKENGRLLDIHSNKPVNYGGVSLGNDGEETEVTTIDRMDHIDIGFIHCDTQGAENFIFSNGINTIAKYRPVIYFEDNANSKNKSDVKLYQNICDKYPQYKKESQFSIEDFCLNKLNYSVCIHNFNGIDHLLIP